MRSTRKSKTSRKKSKRKQKIQKTEKAEKAEKEEKTEKAEKTRTRKQYNGVVEEIQLRQILITQPIRQAIQEYNPALNVSEYKNSLLPQGFRLSRIEQMMRADFSTLLTNDPVELKKAFSSEGKPLGAKIDGQMKRLYEIVNGRHRIARAILESRPTILANILE